MSSYFLDTLNCCKVNWNYFYQESWNSKQIICPSRSLPLSFSLYIPLSLSKSRSEFGSGVCDVFVSTAAAPKSQFAAKNQSGHLSLSCFPPHQVCVCAGVCWCVCALMCVVKCRHFFMCTPWAIFPLYTSFYAPATRVEKKKEKKKQNHLSAWNLTLQKLWAAVAWWHQCTHVCTYSMSVYSRRIAIITLGNQIQRAELIKTAEIWAQVWTRLRQWDSRESRVVLDIRLYYIYVVHIYIYICMLPLLLMNCQ